MIKELVILYRLPHLDRAHFRDYYERHHVPLIVKLLPTISRYVRNYVESDSFSNSGSAPVSWDALTEIWFETPAAHEAFLTAISNSDVIRVIRKDEENFIDSKRSQRILVQESVTPDAMLQA